MKELFGPIALASFLSLAASACTGSEPIAMPGSGGHNGSGSGGATTMTGSGGAGDGGSGGRGMTGSGGATGGTTGGGSGGARNDAGKDVSPTDGAADASDGGELLSYDVDVAYMLFFSCGGCHLSTSTQGNFDMKIASPTAPGPTAYQTITAGVNAEHAGCTKLDPASKKRVVPFKPDNSLLYIKISTASPPSGCGKHMPDGANMTAEQIAKIRLWITQGARP
jgi:hypothetical protein